METEIPSKPFRLKLVQLLALRNNNNDIQLKIFILRKIIRVILIVILYVSSLS